MVLPKEISENGIALAIFTPFIVLMGWILKLITGKYIATVEDQVRELRDEVKSLKESHEQNENRINKMQNEERRELIEALNNSTAAMNNTTATAIKGMEVQNAANEVMREQRDALKLMYERLVSIKHITTVDVTTK